MPGKNKNHEKSNKGTDFSKDFDERSDILNGDSGDNSISGGGGNDQIYGNDGNDALGGGHGNDSLYGGKGDDRLGGHRDDDFLSGGDGDDMLDGGFGNDVLIGGSGDDTMAGGRGQDVFVFEVDSGHDTVTDFDVGDDILDLTMWNVDAQQLAIEVTEEGGTVISYGDMSITLLDVSSLSVDDFLI